MSVVDGLPFAEDRKKYIIETLDPLLEEMIVDVLAQMPENTLDFCVNWLKRRSGAPMTARMSIQQQNTALKQEFQRISSVFGEISSSLLLDEQLTGSAAEPVKDEEEEEDEDDCGDEIPDSMKRSEESSNRARASVSAEAYGAWNTKKEFEPPQYPKTDDQKARLEATLKKSFLFVSLEPKDLETVILAMKEYNFKPGETVITEGENGDFLFVIEKGVLDCMKVIDGKDTVIKTCREGDVFGELALLYNCPRAASVTAKEDCVCWQLDRDSFNNIVKDSAMKRREKYDTFLKSVTLLSSISAYERSQISDALVPEVFKQGDVIINQDEPGDKFYIVEEGSLYAQKAGGSKVMDYKAGDYFGELALLKNQPRAASVIVSSETARVLTMSRQSFSKMLGPLQHIIANRVQSYA